MKLAKAVVKQAVRSPAKRSATALLSEFSGWCTLCRCPYAEQTAITSITYETKTWWVHETCAAKFKVGTARFTPRARRLSTSAPRRVAQTEARKALVQQEGRPLPTTKVVFVQTAPTVTKFKPRVPQSAKSSTKALKSRYSGICAKCTRGYDVGEEIAAYERRWGHVACVKEAVRVERESWFAQGELNPGESRGRLSMKSRTPADHELHKRVTRLLNGDAI